jgi:hypothetical protein
MEQFDDLKSVHLARGNNFGPNYVVGFFGPQSFIILKSSHQGLSNEGQNFFDSILIIDLLKHSHCFDKLQILAPSNNLKIGQNSEFAKF